MREGIGKECGLRRLLIFTDLDGSLLDKADYSYAGAKPALNRIARLGIPLIIASSKTRAEIEVLQRELGVTAPFIVENGGGIFFPDAERKPAVGVDARCGGVDEVVTLGVPYVRIRSFLEGLPRSIRVRGFGDMTDREVAAASDLTLERAALAKKRDFTEPFLIEEPSVLPALTERAEQAELRVVRGGRFYHLTGAGQDKGLAVRIVRERFAKRQGGPAVAIGLGDSENDLPLLAAVDVPVLIPQPDGSPPHIDLPGLIHADEPGSRGWNGAVQRLLDQFGFLCIEEQGKAALPGRNPVYPEGEQA